MSPLLLSQHQPTVVALSWQTHTSLQDSIARYRTCVSNIIGPWVGLQCECVRLGNDQMADLDCHSSAEAETAAEDPVCTHIVLTAALHHLLACSCNTTIISNMPCQLGS